MFSKFLTVKVLFVAIAIIIAVASLLVSNRLTTDLKEEEKNKMELFAEAQKSMSPSYQGDVGSSVIIHNKNIPVILIDKHGKHISHNNFPYFEDDEDSISYLEQRAQEFKSNGNVIKINLSDEQNEEDYDQEICYDDSIMLKRLSIYPYVQLAIVSVFVFVAVFALFFMMKSEQNKVWVGLSKETAHQLGTPISSLMAWTMVLKEAHPEDPLIPEMENDVKRLERIAERFSKIGSIPEPKPEDLCDLLYRVVGYMDRRTSNKVKIITHFPSDPVIVNLIPSLFEWVGENLCKNAVDAMAGQGQIDVSIFEQKNIVAIEFVDNGKGIPRNQFQKIFKPGFTTKQRGWGLGLSLAKRIIEEYHHGKIYVKNSEVGVGTTFRIELNK